MKKLIILLSISLLLCGCEVNYNLDFTDDTLTEDITVSLDKSRYSIENFEELKNYNFFAINDILNPLEYEKEFKEESHNYIGNYKYKYFIFNYNSSNILSTCYDVHSFINDENQYILTTSNVFKCMPFEYMDVDKITITLTTNHKVIDNNADKISGDKYIWEITNENKENKPIKIIFDKEKEDKNDINYIIVLLVIFGTTGIIAFILWRIYKKNDEI